MLFLYPVSLGINPVGDMFVSLSPSDVRNTETTLPLRAKERIQAFNIQSTEHTATAVGIHTC